MGFVIEISRFLNENLHFLWILAVVFGAWTILSELFRLINFLYAKLIRKRLNLAERYGKGTWAFITGSSEGIGKQFALSLAKQGFNIILSARTLSKLKQTQSQIHEAYPNVKVLIVTADYITTPDKQNIEATWYKTNQLDKLDISIIVNNAGVDYLDKFTNVDLKFLINQININCFFQTQCIIFSLKDLIRKSNKVETRSIGQYLMSVQWLQIFRYPILVLIMHRKLMQINQLQQPLYKILILILWHQDHHKFQLE